MLGAAYILIVIVVVMVRIVVSCSVLDELFSVFICDVQ